MDLIIFIPYELLLKEKWQQELVAKRAEEEVERDRKLDEACKTLELRMQRVKEMEKELEQERKALAERLFILYHHDPHHANEPNILQCRVDCWYSLC